LDRDPMIMCGLVSQVEYRLMVDPKGGNYNHFETGNSKSGKGEIILKMHAFCLL
jgi:hypothetical protein